MCSYYRSYYLLESRQSFFIHRAHHVWFDEYNYRIYIDYKHNPGYLLLQQDPESLTHNSYLLNLIDLTSTQFYDTKNLSYEIELPPYGKKVGYHLLDDEYFTIPNVIDTIPNSPAGHQLPKMIRTFCGSLLSM